MSLLTGDEAESAAADSRTRLGTWRLDRILSPGGNSSRALVNVPKKAKRIRLRHTVLPPFSSLPEKNWLKFDEIGYTGAALRTRATQTTGPSPA